MKKGWETKTLGDFFDITSSKRVFKSDWTSEGVPFYRAREIVSLSKGKPLKDPIFISSEMYDEYTSKYGKPEEGDILVTGVGTLGICYVVKKNDKFYFKDGNIIWLKNTSNINTKFIEYFFKSKELIDQINSAPVGATVGTFTIVRAKNTSISIPPKSEQKQIVDILDKKFEAIENLKTITQEQLLSAKELFESRLNQVFLENETNDKLRSLGEVSEKIENISWKNVPTKEFNYIDLSAVSRESLSVSNSVLINANNAPSRAKKLVLNGDIIFGTTRPTLKRVAKITKEFDKYICSTGFAVIRPKTGVAFTDYIFYFLQTTNFNDRMKEVQRGASYPAVSDKDVQDTKLYLPSLEKQKQLTKELDDLSQKTKGLEAIFKQKIADLEELKKSYLNEAFSGKL